MSTWAARLENPISARLRDPSTTGFLGILLGAFAAFLAIPPIEARTVTWPVCVATPSRTSRAHSIGFVGLAGCIRVQISGSEKPAMMKKTKIAIGMTSPGLPSPAAMIARKPR